MKNLCLLCLVLLLGGSTLMAQTDLSNYSFSPEVKETERLMSKGQKNAFSVVVNGRKKDVDDKWSDFTKKRGAKSKWNKKTKEYLADNAEIESISDNTIDIYSQLIESGDNTELVVWFDLGGAYLSSYDHRDKAAIAEQLLTDFARQQEIRRIDHVKGDEEDRLKNLEKDLKNLEKDKKNLEEDIDDYMKKIEEAKKKIAENETNQSNKNTEIATQKAMVEQVKDIRSQLDKMN